VNVRHRGARRTAPPFRVFRARGRGTPGALPGTRCTTLRLPRRPTVRRPRPPMTLSTLLIVLLIVALFGGGGFYWSRR
jgi:hypothetical protein